MGTDIHLYVERRVNDEWEMVQPFYQGRYGGRSWSPWSESDDFKDPRPDPTGRDYNLFAFLADVRNGYGFASVRTHQPVKPQFANRGLPVTTTYRESDDEDAPDLGDHSFTFAYLDELLKAPWDMTFHSQGVVGPKEFKVWRATGIPSGWCGGISGKDVVTHDDPDEYEKMIAEGRIRTHNTLGVRDYCLVHWSWQPLIDCGFRRWLDQLEELTDDTRLLRVLMGFDS